MPSRLAAFREGTVERRRGEREDGNEGEELKEGRKRNEKGRETEEGILRPLAKIPACTHVYGCV